MKKRVVINPKFAQFQEFVNNIDGFFDTEGELVYKKRNVVKRFKTHHGFNIIVKRYKHPNVIQQIGYTLYRPSKARRAYEFAIRLDNLGIDTPTPIAYVELWEKGVFTMGFFFASENNDRSCKDLYADSISGLDSSEKDMLENELVDFIARCHEYGFMHGDTNLSNFIYHKTSEGYHFAVIDINRSKFVNVPPTQAQCLDNLMRLTHDKPLLKRLVGKYACRRGWEPQACQEYVIAHLEKFERKKKALKLVK